MALIKKRRVQRATATAKYAALKIECSVLSRIAPQRAADKIIKLWCTLPDNHGRWKDARPYPGQVSEVRDQAGRRIAVESWGEGPLIYLVHGWGSWRGQLGSFIDPLVKAGYQVVGFDCLSHGESDPGEWGPGRSHGGEMIESFRHVAKAWGPAAGVLAHSLGGATATLVIRDGLSCGRIALVSPVQDLRVPLKALGATLGMSKHAISLLSPTMSRAAKCSLDDFDIASQTEALPPGILIHDTHDKETPYANSLRIDAAWTDGHMETTEFLGHQRILNDPSVVDLVVQSLTCQDVQPGGC